MSEFEFERLLDDIMDEPDEERSDDGSEYDDNIHSIVQEIKRKLQIEL